MIDEAAVISKRQKLDPVHWQDLQDPLPISWVNNMCFYAKFGKISEGSIVDVFRLEVVV